MGTVTGIAWADSTFNPWIGCTKVGPGCDHCYASVSTPARSLGVKWGAGQARHRTSAENWRKPLAWNAEAERTGVRRRVFCASLADVFDNEVPTAWRWALFRLIRATPALTWMLLTKRIGLARDKLNDAAAAVANDHIGALTWDRDPWPNVWIGATIVNQYEADRDIPKLLATPAAKRFVSMEPLLGPVDLILWLIGDQPHDEQRSGISGVHSHRDFLGGSMRENLATSAPHSGKSRRNSAILEGHPEARSGDIQVGWIPDRDVFGRNETTQGVCSPDGVDAHQPVGHPGGHGNQPQGRGARQHDAEQSGTDDAIAKRDSRDTGAGSKAKGAERAGQPFSTPHGVAGSGHSSAEREDRSISTCADVRRQPTDDFKHRHSKDLEAPGIDWVIVGGESDQPGMPARQFDIEWARETVRQCRAAGVPAFVKQMGSNPAPLVVDHGAVRDRLWLNDRAGADPMEWPTDLRIQEFPNGS